MQFFFPSSAKTCNYTATKPHKKASATAAYGIKCGAKALGRYPARHIRIIYIPPGKRGSKHRKNSKASNLNYMARNLNLMARSFYEMPCSFFRFQIGLCKPPLSCHFCFITHSIDSISQLLKMYFKNFRSGLMQEKSKKARRIKKIRNFVSGIDYRN